MPSPKLKTNDILAQLRPSVDAGRLLVNDFEKQRLIRESRKIPERYQSLAIEGMIQLLDGKVGLGTDALDRAIGIYPKDYVTWINYSAVLTKKAMFSKLLEVLNAGMKHDLLSVYYEYLSYGAFWADIPMLKHALEKIGSADSLDRENQSYKEAIYTFNMLNSLDERSAQDVNKAAEVIRFIAEKHGIPCQRSWVEDDGNNEYSFSCEVDIDDPAFLMALNKEVISEMVSKGYEMGRCVAYFSSCAEVD